MAGDDHVPVEIGHRLLDTAQRSGVRGGLGIDDRGERLLGAAAGVRHHLLQVVEALVAQAVDLPLGKGRRQGHLSEQRDGVREVSTRHLDVHREAVPARGGAHLGAQTFCGLDEGHRVVLGRPLGHGARREHGRACLLRGLAAGATAGIATDDELRLQQRPTGHMASDDREPVVERRALEGGKVVLARLAGLGPPVQDGQWVGHAAASSVTRGT